MNRITLFILLLTLGSIAQAQNNNRIWTPEQNQAEVSGRELLLRPGKYKAFSLDVESLKSTLSQAPMEFTEASRLYPVTVSIPDADGVIRMFRIVESPIMAPELGAKYPEIKTYAGSATDGSGILTRLGVGSNGFHAFLQFPDGRQHSVAPETQIAGNRYMAYNSADLPVQGFASGDQFCGVVDAPNQLHKAIPEQNNSAANRSVLPVTLKKYRLALSASGEYSQFIGGTKPAVMSAMTVAMNYINAIMERDFGVRLEMIANTDLLIYLDPATDPFTGNLDTWIGQNHANANATIGAANYDIGHMFSVTVPGNGIVGLAFSGQVCSILGKGAGGSTAPQPVGEYFYGVAAHEMCHQMSGSHTWNQCTEDIAGQLAPNGAFEPGSGSTIMSYAGSCLSNDVASDKDPYFHAGSIEQVQFFIYQDDGQYCGTVESTDNNHPVVTFPLPNNYYIPINTPFKFTAEGSDPDGDAITYCWEEYDLGPSIPLGETSLTAPQFRSYPPGTSPTRICPKIGTIINNQTTLTEILPDYNREFNFRCTVRDNHPSAGGQASVTTRFHSTTQAGPFTITYPNAANVFWHPGEYRIVTWDVANTDKAPVNCQTVNILLSTNTGVSYSIVLASDVPNSGSACIQVPNNISNLCRIMVEANDNIFFDISNSNFRITAPTTPEFSICTDQLEARVCIPETYTQTINTGSVMGFDTAIELSASGLPNGVEAIFSPNPVVPGQDAVMTINFPPGFAEGNYNVQVNGTAGTTTLGVGINMKVVSNNFDALALEQPLDGTIGVVQTPVLKWNGVPDADTYEVQIATNPSFSAPTIIAANANVSVDTFKTPVALQKGVAYYWRVRPKNECGIGPWQEPFSFATLKESCTTLSANDLPKPISSNGTPTVESKINVPLSGTISDINVTKFQGSHNFFKDLEAHLIGPDGTDVLLFGNKCPQTASFNFGFNDAAPSVFGCPPPNNSALYQPTGSLSAFNGKNSNGMWTLRVKDNVSTSGGTLSGFELEFCSNIALNAPLIVHNLPLVLPGGVNAPITNNLLLTEDADNTPNELIYTLVTVPQGGRLEWNWTGAMEPGDQFNQTDINNGALRFFDYGSNLSGIDQFRFTVVDGQGGFASGTFNIVLNPLGTQSAASALEFSLAPNPAQDFVQVSFSQGLHEETELTLWNTAGQMVRKMQAPQGAVNATLPTADLPKGVYALAIQNAEGKAAKTVIIQ